MGEGVADWVADWVGVWTAWTASTSSWWPAAWADWLSYRPSDFLMFAPRTYWQLFERHNQSVGPAFWLIWLSSVLGLAALWQLRGSKPPLKALAVGLAWAWGAVGWFFMHQLYAPVFWAMTGAAWAFFVQALLLGGWAVLQPQPQQHPSKPPHALRAAYYGGLLLVAWAVLIHPLLAVLAQRPWAQAEVVGLAPDPTAIATLGLLLCMAKPAGPMRVLYELMWALALAWCVFSAATLWTMGSAQGWVPALAGAASLAWRIRFSAS